MRRLASAAIGLARALRLTELLRLTVARLPRPAQLWIEDKRLNAMLRSGNAASLVPEAELERTYRRALTQLLERRGGEALGDYLEFGVYAGSSLACMDGALKELDVTGMRMFGFDSFEGLPAEASDDDGGHWRPGMYRSDLDSTHSYLSRRKVDWSRVTLVKGWFDETLTFDLVARHGIEKAGVIMIDCDIYSAASVALEFCAPIIRDEAIVFFDDWGPLAERDLGEKRAFDEFLREHPELGATEIESYGGDSKAFLIRRHLAGPGLGYLEASS